LMLNDRIEALAAQHNFPDLKVIHFGFLANLDAEGTTSRELTTCLHVTKQAVSKLTKEMENLGFIALKPHATDARSSVIHMTEKGQLLLKMGLTCSEQIKAELSQKVGKKAFEGLIDTLVLLVGDGKMK
jgi:DNA-binding MarR family transcriptional regulator